MSEKAKLRSAWWVEQGCIHLDISGDVRARTHVSERKSVELAIGVLWHNPLVIWPFLLGSGLVGAFLAVVAMGVAR